MTRVQTGLDDTCNHLDAARSAGRRRDGERQLRGRQAGAFRDPGGHGSRGRHPSLHDEHAALGLFFELQFAKQLFLHPGVNAQRAGTHREVALRRNRPTGILRRHAGRRGMVGPHLNARP
jgi:hypothetical protein